MTLLAVLCASSCAILGSDPSSPGDDDDDNAFDVCVDAPFDDVTAQQRGRQCVVGDEAPFLLRSSPYDKILVEVDATSDVVPRQGSLDHLIAVIEDSTNKPGAVTVVLDDLALAPPGTPLSVADVQAMEDSARNNFSLGDTAVVYFLYTSGASDSDSGQFKILGYAHRATSLVIFQETIDSISGGLGQPSSETVESTVVAHELGHVLGLVNLGTPMVDPHADPNNAAHDVDENCLMYFANNSSELLANLLAGGLVPDFDPQCRADMQAIRETTF